MTDLHVPGKLITIHGGMSAQAIADEFAVVHAKLDAIMARLEVDPPAMASMMDDPEMLRELNRIERIEF